jgi:uncharacterized membrane protein
MKKATSLVTLALLACVSFTAISLIVYVAFGRNEQEQWARFGDYFSGVVNPLIAITNLIILVIISYQLANRDDKRNQLPLKHEALIKLGQCMDYLPRPISLEPDDLKMYYTADSKFYQFIRDWQYMFPDSNQYINDFGGQLFLYINNVEQYFDLAKKYGPQSSQARRKHRFLTDFFENEMMSSYGLLRKSMRDSM